MLTASRSWILFGFSWIFWAILHAWIVQSGFNWYAAGIDSAVSNLLLALVCFAMTWSLRYYRPGTGNMLYLFFWIVILSAIWLLAVNALLKTFYRDDPALLAFLHQSLPVRFCIGFLLIGCFMLMSWVWFYLNAQQAEEKRLSDMEKLANEAELNALREQLQPHFLFNTLNSISALVNTRPEDARSMIHQLSDFLRGTLKKNDQELVTMNEELKHLQLYLDIEKVRFGHRLKAIVEHDEKSLSAFLPALLLQPVVENAIKFGLYDTTGEVTIHMGANMEQDYLNVRISNPYDPETAKPRQGTGFGLNSVNRRLYLIFGRNDLLITKAGENVFSVSIKIPQHK